MVCEICMLCAGPVRSGRFPAPRNDEQPAPPNWFYSPLWLDFTFVMQQLLAQHCFCLVIYAISACAALLCLCQCVTFSWHTCWRLRFWHLEYELHIWHTHTHGPFLGLPGTEPHSRQITAPAPHHSDITGWMPFLLPNQQFRSTEDSLQHAINLLKS